MVLIVTFSLGSSSGKVKAYGGQELQTFCKNSGQKLKTLLQSEKKQWQKVKKQH